MVPIIATVFVYGVYVGYPAVFDDHNIFTNLEVYNYALVPFSSNARTFPYFLLGFVHVISGGDLAWNRWFNIILFGLMIAALYFFLVRAMTRFALSDSVNIRWAASTTCLWFALNPVAVYAVGYLIQRTIVMATLFSIIAVNLYLRAQQKKRNADLFSAALIGGLAMMCKEHAVLLPAAAIALTPLVRDWDRKIVLRAGGFLMLMLPVCYWTISHQANIVGTSYEIYSGQVLSQITLFPLFDFPGGIWVMSIVTQLGLFLRYLFSWLIPYPGFLSADIRIDFSDPTTITWLMLGSLTTLATGATAIWLSFRNNTSPMLGLVAAAILYAVILYCVELSVVRVQEPFVLYRSFLWAPAYALLVCAFLLVSSRWLKASSRKAWMIFCVSVPLACLALVPWSQDRLESFSSEEALWQDALRKLPSPTIAGADRIYYNLAGEAYKAKRYAEALDFSERTIAQSPESFQGYLAKGTSLLAMGNADGAAKAFDEASSRPFPPQFRGYIQFKRCLVLEIRGDTALIVDCLRESTAMGYSPAEFRLKMMGVL